MTLIGSTRHGRPGGTAVCTHFWVSQSPASCTCPQGNPVEASSCPTWKETFRKECRKTQVAGGRKGCGMPGILFLGKRRTLRVCLRILHSQNPPFWAKLGSHRSCKVIRMQCQETSCLVLQKEQILSLHVTITGVKRAQRGSKQLSLQQASGNPRSG